jgi:hypothetical protein
MEMKKNVFEEWRQKTNLGTAKFFNWRKIDL